MSSAWKSVTAQWKTPPSRTSVALGIKDETDDVRKFCDTLVTNDLRSEFYYTTADIARDAFEAHARILKQNPKAYAEIVQTLEPVSLDAQKVLAALHLWDDKKTNRALVEKLLSNVRPAWWMTFFMGLRKKPSYATYKGGYNRTVRAMVRDRIANLKPYMVVKYADKLHPIAAWAHVDAKMPQMDWIFNGGKHLTEFKGDDMLYRDVRVLGQTIKTGNPDSIMAALRSMRLPYTVAVGIFGTLSKRPEVAKVLLDYMTPWETILGFKKLGNAGLDLSDPEVLSIIEKKLKPEKLKDMRIDSVELFQAYQQLSGYPKITSFLQTLIDEQVKSVGVAIASKLEGLKVAVVFDCSPSMENVSEWSMMLAYAISANLPKVDLFAFSTECIEYSFAGKPLIQEMASLKNNHRLWNGTDLGNALASALNKSPDVIFYISDFEDNGPIRPANIAEEYTQKFGTFPVLYPIKFTTSPWTAQGEPAAMQSGRWLNTPDEYPISVRNLWDLPNLLEYTLKLLPMLRKRGLLTETPSGVH